jgi:hypothetical protein
MPLRPTPKASPSPSAPPSGNVLPFDSTLFFVLDDQLSSKSSKTNEFVRVHLRDALVVAGKTIAPAGTPAEIRILDVSPADLADTYGYIDIYFEPMTLPDGRALPLRAPEARLAPRVSSGHESTVEAEDTVGDIFVPYYSLYQIFRHGKNFVLRPGATIPARTDATITALANGTVTIVTPRPLTQASEVPNATFPVQAESTPLGGVPTPKPKGGSSSPAPSAPPTPTPWPSPATPTPTP